MKAEDFKYIVDDAKQFLGISITSRTDVESMIDFVIELANYSDDDTLADKLCSFYDEVENISTSDLVAVGCDDDWWLNECKKQS